MESKLKNHKTEYDIIYFTVKIIFFAMLAGFLMGVGFMLLLNAMGVLK